MQGCIHVESVYESKELHQLSQDTWVKFYKLGV